MYFIGMTLLLFLSWKYLSSKTTLKSKNKKNKKLNPSQLDIITQMNESNQNVALEAVLQDITRLKSDLNEIK